MKNDFIIAVNQVCSERSLPKEVVLEAIEAALISAYKRNFGAAQDIIARIDPDSGQAQVYAEKKVVEEVVDKRAEVSLEEARKIDENAAVGETIMIEATPRNFGRIAAQTAKQVILQRIREAEREALYNSYADREGEIITGTVQSIDSQAVTLNLGKTEAILPRKEQITGERQRLNQRIKAYVLEVQKTNRGPQIIVSRTHRNMLRRLLELEVPEIFSGTVEIKTIAREAGSRSKVAVAALQEGIDPVGSCVGMRGVRIQSIVNELNGEKIDVVEWNPDTSVFVANALSPAKVLNVRLEESQQGGKTATVIVPDHQLSLAIGKEGQNARLAAKLTGWRIDIKSASEAAEEALHKEKGAEGAPAVVPAEDLLSVAEAILLGKEVTVLPKAEITLSMEEQSAEEAAVETEQRMESLAEGEPEVMAADEALVEEAGPEMAVSLEELVTDETEAEVMAAEGETEPETAVPLEELVTDETGAEVMAVEGETEPETPVEEAAIEIVEELAEIEEAVEVEEEEYVEERDEEESKGKSKKKKSRRKGALVYDEELGQMILKRRYKPSRRRDWDLDED